MSLQTFTLRYRHTQTQTHLDNVDTLTHRHTQMHLDTDTLRHRYTQSQLDTDTQEHPQAQTIENRDDYTSVQENKPKHTRD